MRSGEEDEDFIWFHGFKTERKKKNNNRMKVKRNNTVIVAVCVLMKS